MTQRPAFAGFIGLFLALSGAALGQAPTAAPDGALETYDRAFFAQFNAISAEDLLKRIPGIQDLIAAPAQALPGAANQQQQSRGFGSSGVPILFNGRRLSGKTNDPRAALQRIQASQIVRIEVIRGSVPGLDIRVGNEGAILNIVLEDELTSGAGAWEASMTYYTSGLFKPGGRLSYTGTSGPLSYVASIVANPFFSRRYTRDTFTLPPNPAPNSRLRLIDQNAGTDYTATGSLGYAFANGGVANLNGRYSIEEHILRQPVDNFVIPPTGPERFVSSGLQLRDTDGDIEWEIGGDYEYTFADDDSIRALFIVTDDRRPSDAQFFSAPPGLPLRYDRQQIVKSTRTEKIARGFYRWVLNEAHSIEAGGEVALNGIDQRIQRLDNIGGTFRDAPLFNPDSNVDETRFETFLNYGWQVDPALFVEAAVDTETSKLKQRGRDVNTSRSFTFVKPRLDVRYDPLPQTQIRARVLRTVSQLDFANFVSSFSTDDVRLGVILFGNPNLVPEKAWTVETTLERRLDRGRGIVSLRGFYNRISDVIDKVPITPDFAGTGNIGRGKTYGAELKMGLRLDDLGLKRASLDASGTWQNSSVTDPFTFDRREFVSFPNYRWNVSFRQDTDWHNFAYGVVFNDQDKFLGSDIDFRHQFSFTPDADVFAEVRAAGLTFRLDAQRLLRHVHRDRLQFVGPRSRGVVFRREFRFDTFVKIYKFTMKGTF